MTIFSEISELSPKLVKYPVEMLIKAFVNLALNRKVPSSICRILAAFIGIAIGIMLPQLSEIALFFAYIALDINLSLTSAITISTIISSWVCCSACIHLTKKAFQSYYFHKYGDSNSEHRLTENEKRYIYNNNLDKTDEEIKKLIAVIEKRIDLIIVELQQLKIKENENAIKHVKLVLNKLKKGDLEFFDEYYDSGITKDTRKKKRYDYSSNRAGILSNNKKSYKSSYSKSLTTEDSESSDPLVNSNSTILTAFQSHTTKKDCQDASTFDILAVNKSRL